MRSPALTPAFSLPVITVSLLAVLPQRPRTLIIDGRNAPQLQYASKAPPAQAHRLAQALGLDGAGKQEPRVEVVTGHFSGRRALENFCIVTRPLKDEEASGAGGYVQVRVGLLQGKLVSISEDLEPIEESSAKVLDIDGDGRDEVLVLKGHGSHDYLWHYLEVWGFNGESFLRLAQFTVFEELQHLDEPNFVDQSACVIFYVGGPLDQAKSFKVVRYMRKGSGRPDTVPWKPGHSTELGWMQGVSKPEDPYAAILRPKALAQPRSKGH